MISSIEKLLKLDRLQNVDSYCEIWWSSNNKFFVRVFDGNRNTFSFNYDITKSLYEQLSKEFNLSSNCGRVYKPSLRVIERRTKLTKI